jgi:hypothetical protein
MNSNKHLGNSVPGWGMNRDANVKAQGLMAQKDSFSLTLFTFHRRTSPFLSQILVPCIPEQERELVLLHTGNATLDFT